jgi:hypothetical protein
MQATQTIEAPKAPNPPLAPTSVTTVGSDGKTLTLAIPQTADEISALRARREELSSQLNSVAERRSELVSQLSSAPEGAARTGLEDRIRLLDQRTLGLESDIAAIGRQIASAPANLLSYEEERPNNNGGGAEWDEGLMVGAGSMLFAFVMYKVYRRVTKRIDKRTSPKAAPALAADSARLERLEHSVEAIAIEVERISEGQRFVTRLLSENSQGVPAPTLKG